MLESLDEDLSPPVSADEVEDTPIKKEDDVNEEREPLCHKGTTGDFESNHIKVKSDISDSEPN